MKSPLKHMLVAAVVLACVICGVFYTRRARASTPRKAASRPSSTAPVPAAIAVVGRHRLVNTVSVAGEFLPYEEVELHAKVAGYIRKINVDIGDHVRAGQVIAVLEVPELNAQVEGADATVRHSQEEIARARDEVRHAEANHAALHSAAIRLQQAAAARPGLIAAQELEDALARDRASEAQIDVAKAALAAAEQGLNVSKAARAQVSALQDYSRIVAPFDGVVTWRYADTGALVQAGTSNASSMPVVKLARISTLRLRFPVPESLATRVRVGSSAEVHVEATGERFTGRVVRMSDSFDRSTRTMQAEVDVPNSRYRLSPGMYADVALDVESSPDALAIPIQAVERSENKTTVLVVNSQDRVELREVRLGIEDPNLAEVVSGVKPGERVIVGNPASFQPGERVDPRPSVLAAGLREGGGRQ